MKKFAILLTVSFSFLISNSAFTQYDDHDAVYQRIVKSYTLNSDGRLDYRYIKTQKLQSYNAFHRLFGETFIVYNPDFQNLKINEAYTIMADGRKVNSPENAFNKVLPRFARNIPPFNHLREMVITHTALEIGATIHLNYELHTNKGFFPALMGTEILTESQPVTKLSITVKVPTGQELYYRLVNSDEKPVVDDENGYRSYVWQLRNIPAITESPHQIKHHGNYPVLVFSTEKGFEKLISLFVDQKAFTEQDAVPIEEYVTGLTNEKTNNKEIIFELQETVVNDLNLFFVPEKYSGFRLRMPQEVWQSNGGTVAEKALLLATMLKQAGLEANPVLVFEGNSFDKNIGNLTNLDSWIVKTNISGTGKVYLAVDQVNAYNMTTLLPGEVFLEINEDGSFGIEKVTEEKTEIMVKGIFSIDKEMTLSGDISGEVRGRSNPSLALLRSENKLKHYFSGGISSADIQSLSVSESTLQKSIFSCTVKKKDALKQDSGFYFLPISYMKNGIKNWGIRYLEQKRTVPLALLSPLVETYEYTIAIPENMNLLSGEKKIQLNNSAGTFLFSVKQKDRIIQVNKSIRIKESVIKPSGYEDFKELMDNWNLQQTGKLIFRK